MEPTQTVINALLLGAFATSMWLVTRAQTRSLERRLDRHEDRTDARFDRLEARIEAIDTKLDSKIDAVRADITQLAFRLGDRPHPQTG